MNNFSKIPEFREIDYRRSGEVEYFLYWQKIINGLALVAIDPFFERAVEVPNDQGNDSMLHPEPRLQGKDAVIIGTTQELEL